VTSPFADLARPPLRTAALRRALVDGDGLWTSLDVVTDTGSTNADLVRAAASGAPEGSVLVAEHQHAGRGRGDRVWTAPPRSGLAVSALLRPPPRTRPRWGWLPLLAGVAVATAIRRVAEVEAVLKWPNDVLLGDRKVGGVLIEVAGDAVIVGIGLNVSLRSDELPVPSATSLLLAGAASTDRDPLLRALLREMQSRYVAWREHAGDPDAGELAATYRRLCCTLGRDVTVHLPGGATRGGRAVDVDRDGCLVLAVDGERETLAAGDVVHLR
jgi:BirA family biotin operon repressor/biotin-[acetyl-CoA-carboxylase] ligase